jgi:crotonobetainyl-CoA:carnitine CoA-transferase CaiB-like acyl-CoA transferase
MGNRHPSIAPYEVFSTADRPFVLAVGNDRQFESLVRVLGAPELASDDRFTTNTARVANREELTKILDELLSADTADGWFDALTAARVPCGPLNDIADAVALAERLGLAPVVEIDDPRRDAPLRQIANPIRLSATPATYLSAPPSLA